MYRRRFLSLGGAAVGSGLVTAQAARAGAASDDGIVDTNVWLSHWPTRYSGVESPRLLVDKLRRHGVISAWTGSFEAALHSDIAGLNARLAETCARDGGGVLVPFGTINPTLPDWEEDVRRCHEAHRMAGIRLLPNYHGYQVDDARFARLLELSAQRGLLVQIVLSMEDQRSQNPQFTTPPVPIAPVMDVLTRFPRARTMLLNSTPRTLTANAPLRQRVVETGTLIEIATLEGVAGIDALLESAPDLRLAFGSHAPYFYFEAALLKLQESGLTGEQLAAIRHGHARAALNADARTSADVAKKSEAVSR